MSAFVVNILENCGVYEYGVVEVERTGKRYNFRFYPAIQSEDGAGVHVILQQEGCARCVPLNQLRDVRNAVREHFKAEAAADETKDDGSALYSAKLVGTLRERAVNRFMLAHIGMTDVVNSSLRVWKSRGRRMISVSCVIAGETRRIDYDYDLQRIFTREARRVAKSRDFGASYGGRATSYGEHLRDIYAGTNFKLVIGDKIDAR